MANFRETFRELHAVLPVVHVVDENQALENAKIAEEAGADGIFLISMLGDEYSYLNEVHSAIRLRFPSLWVGVNYLDLMDESAKVFGKLNSQIPGVWVDNAGIKERQFIQYDAMEIDSARKQSGWDGLYFGGVGFKYQRKIAQEDLTGVAEVAKQYMDVITTSGDRTGKAPDPAKIALMKIGLGSHPLAIASGITPDNVHLYLGTSDAYLVASSLLIGHSENFDYHRVKALVDAVRGR